MRIQSFFIFLVVFLYVVCSCAQNSGSGNSSTDIDYRESMRRFVIMISEYAKSYDADFYIIPQNGIELVTENSEEDGDLSTEYLNAIDGNGQEDLFYGYEDDDEATPADENTWLKSFLDISKNSGNVILVTDYCYTHAKMDDSYTQNNTSGYVSFAADERDLINIPDYPDPIYNENSDSVSSLDEVRNFLYLINPEDFSSKNDFISEVTAANYDLLIMDLFFHDGTEFTSSEINRLRSKANGGKRLIICYMSIGEAEDYRYYWQTKWNFNKQPEWLDEENPDWEGNYKVKYWIDEWQQVITGNKNSYLKKIIDAGFDGVYLDIIEAFEYYE